MPFVFDTSSFRVIDHYFPNSFPSFWSKFDEAVAAGILRSVREVRRELERQGINDHLKEWVKSNARIFATPENEETEFVRQIFTVPHFRQLIGQRQQLRGDPVADPFVIAAAHVVQGVVVTEESFRPNAAKIPNVCDHFQIPYTNLEGFMRDQGWSF